VRIQGYGQGEIIERLEKIIQIYDTYLNKEKVSNILPRGYFTLSDAVFGRVMLLCQIGICPDDKAEILFQNSLEKGQRLFSNFAHQHKSSWQSRDGVTICRSGFYSSAYSVFFWIIRNCRRSHYAYACYKSGFGRRELL